jgi:hypothetical protein
MTSSEQTISPLFSLHRLGCDCVLMSSRRCFAVGCWPKAPQKPRSAAVRRQHRKLLELLQRRSVILNASASGISCTPAVGSALLAHAGSGLAGTVDHDHTRPATHTGFRDHAAGLISWRERHCLCGGSERQPEQGKHYYSDHCFLPVVQNSSLYGLLGSLLAGVAQDRERATSKIATVAATIRADPAMRVLVLAGDDIAVRMNPQ